MITPEMVDAAAIRAAITGGLGQLRMQKENELFYIMEAHPMSYMFRRSYWNKSSEYQAVMKLLRGMENNNA